MQLLPIATLLLGVVVVLAGGWLARRRRLPEAAGLGASLCAIALGVALIPNELRTWLAGGDAGGNILAFARDVGLIGLFFLAGFHFDAKEAWKARRISIYVAAAGLLLLSLTAVLFRALGNQDTGAAIVTAAAIFGTSLWFPGELARISEHKVVAAAASRGAAAVLTTLSMLTIHIYASLDGIAGRRPSGSAYAIVVAYELLKVAVFFSLSYFVATRFLERANSRISPARMSAAYLLIFVLISTLAMSAIGQLGALAWSFIAGAILCRSGAGATFRKIFTPVAAALPFSLVFLSILLQPHGRSSSSTPVVLLVVVAAVIAKFTIGLVTAKVAGASNEDAKMIAASTLPSAEVAVMFLGFGVTRWLIEGPAYFSVLIYALVSMVLGPIMWRAAGSDESAGAQDQSFESRRSGSKLQPEPRPKTRVISKKVSLAIVGIGAVLLTIASPARAQSSTTATEDDPVARAMKAIEASVQHRTKAAEAVLAASKFVNESTAARKHGDRDRAAEALKEAERLAAESEGFSRSALIDDLARLVASERAALNPAKPQSLGQLQSGRSLAIAVPRSVLARLDQYRDSFAQILQEEGLPVGLLGVALVESGFNPMALSPKGARGIWQFMPATARRYGLEVRAGDDQRTHPEQSTRAASRYLRVLYNQFGDWKLALAGYNAGEARVQRIIDRTGIRDFDEMARRGYLPAETRNYVPAVMAVWARLSGTNFLATTNARQRGQTRGGAVDALTKKVVPAAPSEALSKQ